MALFTPLDMSPLLKLVMTFAANEYLYVGGVSKHWKQAYLSTYGEGKGRLTSDVAYTQSIARLQLAFDVDGAFGFMRCRAECVSGCCP